MKINKGTLIVAAATVAVIILAIVAISSVPANAIAYAEKVTEAKSAIKVQEKTAGRPVSKSRRLRANV